MPYQAKIFLLNLTPKELFPWKISHICRCAFNNAIVIFFSSFLSQAFVSNVASDSKYQTDFHFTTALQKVRIIFKRWYLMEKDMKHFSSNLELLPEISYPKSLWHLYKIVCGQIPGSPHIRQYHKISGNSRFYRGPT